MNTEIQKFAEISCVGRNFANAFMTDVLQQSVGFFQQISYLIRLDARCQNH